MKKPPFSPYHKMSVTYGELDKAMRQLGFQKKIERSRDEVKERLLGRPRFFIVYFTPEDRLYSIFQETDETPVDLFDLYLITRELCELGYLEDQRDLAKLIEKDRQTEKLALAA